MENDNIQEEKKMEEATENVENIDGNNAQDE